MEEAKAKETAVVGYHNALVTACGDLRQDNRAVFHAVVPAQITYVNADWLLAVACLDNALVRQRGDALRRGHCDGQRTLAALAFAVAAPRVDIAEIVDGERV